MNWQKEYQKWTANETLDASLKAQLAEIVSDEKALEDSFYRNMEFGTAGMRGVLGAGTNRMNIYTIRKASFGLAQFVVENGEEAKKRGIVIAYDPRHMSREFAFESAAVLGEHGVKSYVFEALRPTPELSFAVRYLNAFGGIVITASHNPPEYNGYKIYGEDGGQMPPNGASAVTEYIEAVEDIFSVKVADQEELLNDGLLEVISEKVDRPYLERLKEVIVNKELVHEVGKDLKIVFTPLHGTGGILGVPALESVGFTNIIKVDEQFVNDPDFGTVKSPNPENREAFLLAIEYGKKYGGDILVGTDPDADRLGVAVRNQAGDYEILSGNQIGAIILHYLLKQKKTQNELPENAAVLKSIVTSNLGTEIAKHFGVQMIEVLTGFKFIAEQIKQFEETGKHTFEFGYEESNGYMVKSFTRDKDAIQAVLAISEVALVCKTEGRTLLDELEQIYSEFGYYEEDLVSLTLSGKDGSERIKDITSGFREQFPTSMGGFKIERVEDYLRSETTWIASGEIEVIKLPTADVVKCYFEDGSWFCLRPSGTEPKIKFYFSIRGANKEESTNKLEKIKTDLLAYIEA
ncbi:phospho-sugar mutase [Listeria ivanovii]|uniref:Phosphoglucomutase n=1 Tax=Listeria ivanovii (strain ATCC BAA-678 / PAM 55) TaxID=881621 RepID=G2ZFC2_LISIP|nr:phospho-sugar mutase [Listeria ivanovii]AHI56899.1 phosphoglucomutase [Listeria ivanovii WSLC3009]AIS66316.1 phosphoglucomutase [Listeria ivanovii subsp. ivanovii]MBC1759885.1 phospho-sugar mutase [Listeria ivanovii]MBK3915132.1 phospho-sugar mutase [Listeria ivanovii subsp. ivanovii]MBK3922244.1 phospho-sugar mutase [Listeria ivanovii subsp. ivanovii]